MLNANSSKWPIDSQRGLDIPDTPHTRALVQYRRPPSYLVSMVHPEMGKLYYTVESTRSPTNSGAGYSCSLTKSRNLAKVFNDRDTWLRPEHVRRQLLATLHEILVNAPGAIHRARHKRFLAWFESACEQAEWLDAPYSRRIGVVRRNPRNFRQPSSSPATSASRSMNLPSVWKV